MTAGAPMRQLLSENAAGKRTAARLAKPGALAMLAFASGAALLGVAGWFIASSAVAGLAAASTFSFVFPSAGVQALALARTLGRYRERISTHQTTLDLVGSLRTSLFARAVRLPRDRVAELRTSELLGRITVDSDAVENLLLRSAFPILVLVAALIGTVALFATLSAALGIVAMVGLLLAAAILAAGAHQQAGAPARALVLARARARQTLIETLDGLPELRSFGAEQRAGADVRDQLELLAHSRRRLTRLASRGQGVGTVLADLTLVAVIATAAGLVGTGALTAPAFVAVCLVVIAVFEPVGGLPGAVTAIARGRAASARLSELFTDGAAAARGAHIQRDRLWPVEIRLEDQDIELELEAGDTLLLTGASGTGKSTVLRALSGQPGVGVHVRLAGVDAASVDQGALTEHVTLVAQDAHVFDATVRENLQLANPAASEPQLWRALAAAALDDTVAAFPAGLDTHVGPGGAALSGGQRRRLSVAQGLLRGADALLLDEPTEGLDAPTAARLLAGVREFDRTAAVVIALHDRQSPTLPWAPSARVELKRGTRGLR